MLKTDLADIFSSSGNIVKFHWKYCNINSLISSIRTFPVFPLCFGKFPVFSLCFGTFFQIPCDFLDRVFLYVAFQCFPCAVGTLTPSRPHKKA